MLLSNFCDPFIGLNVVSAKGEIGEISYIDPDNVISSDGEGPAIKISWRNGKSSYQNQNMYDKVKVSPIHLERTQR